MSVTPTPDEAGPALQPPSLAELPLFPLQTVLFPDGLLQLKVFEARYLDLISHCLRQQAPFGVVCIVKGSELHGGKDMAQLETIAVLAHLQEVDAEQSGILRVRCLGGRRVQLVKPHQRTDGLWLAEATACPDDLPAAVPPELAASAAALAQAIESLAATDQHPFTPPYRLDDAGWVANRWCEILPISLAARYRLMRLDEPLLRLKLVDDFLRSKGLV